MQNLQVLLTLGKSSSQSSTKIGRMEKRSGLFGIFTFFVHMRVVKVSQMNYFGVFLSAKIKRTAPQDFLLRVLSVSHKPLSIPLGPFKIFSKAQLKVHHWC
jgi:hypothetical protein